MSVSKKKGEQYSPNADSHSGNADSEEYWHQKLRKKWQDMTFANKFMVSFTGVIALCTIVNASVAYWQWEALLASNKINRDALESVQRAFVNASPKAEMATHIANGKVDFWSAEIPVTNFGNTPTRGLLDIANVYPSEKELPMDFNFPDTNKPNQGLLSPRDNIFLEAIIPIADIQSVQTGGHLYVYGWASYWDVFSTKRQHKTEFCYELRLNSIPGDVTSPKYNLPGRFMLCKNHNCSDEDCESEKTTEDHPN